MNVIGLLQLHEAYRAKPYRCPAGKLTVGYGRNLDDVGISEYEATWLLQQDMYRAMEPLKKLPTWFDMGEVRRAVLIDMCVNMGWPRLRKFTRMAAALNRGDYSAAADEMERSAWYSQVGDRAKRLVRMMRDDKWPGE